MMIFPSGHYALCNRIVHDFLGIKIFNGDTDIGDAIEAMLPKYLFREQYRRCIEVFNDLFRWSDDTFFHNIGAFHEVALYYFLESMSELLLDDPDLSEIYFNDEIRKLAEEACRKELEECPELEATWLLEYYLDISSYIDILFDDLDFLMIDSAVNNYRFGNHIVEDVLGIDVDYYFEILPLDIQEEYRRKNKSNCITLYYEIGELFRYLDDRARYKELYKLFWENERPVSEPRIQLILGCIIDAFFHDREIEIIREAATGSGNVDFLFYRNSETDEKVLVEVKCASSITYLRHGFEKQLVAYLLSSKYRHAFYLIACFTDEEYALTKKFIAENVYTEEIQLYVNIRILDLRKRPTASAL